MITRQLMPVIISSKVISQAKASAGEKGWSSQTDAVKDFKSLMKKELNKNQGGRCAFCERILDQEGPQIEHIAYKDKYPQYTFDPQNLVYSCPFCNGFACKGTKDVVILDIGTIDKWQYSIVHPYYDNPQKYFSMIGTRGCEIHVNDGLTAQEKAKALKYIEIFKLDSSAAVERREKDLLYSTLSKDEIDAILAASSFHSI